MLAHSLDSQNISTFRYDKRGVAKSFSADFDPPKIRFEDVEKIYGYLHDTLNYKDIFIIGHSEGSLLGMLASESQEC